MGERLRVRAGNVDVAVVLNETATAAAVAAAAPFEAVAHRWGREVYCAAPVAESVGAAEATAATVELGEVGFWPPGQALCLFFGPTPLSGPNEIRPASPVALIGRIEGPDGVLDRLDAVLEGAPVAVTPGG